MPIDVDALREALGWAPPEGQDWYQLRPEECHFGTGKGYDHRRAVILRRWSSGPIVIVFARTSRRNDSEWCNPAHRHRQQFPACWLEREGYIVTSLPLPVAKDLLNVNSWICTEPDSYTIDAVMLADIGARQ